MPSRRTIGALAAVTAVGASAFLYTVHPARSSDHQDSPAVVARPAADITDVYMFPSPTDASKVDLAMDVSPLIPAGMSGKYFFDPGVLYQFKIAHGPAASKHNEDTEIMFQPSGTGANQKIKVWFENYPERQVGPKTTILGNPVAELSFNRVYASSQYGGVKAFAGPRADPFFFDLFQFFKILPDRNYSNKRTGNMLGTSTPTFNGFASGTTSGPNHTGYKCSTAPSTNALTQINHGFNVLTFVVEVPRSLLVRYNSPMTHLWATTSVPTNQKYMGNTVYQQIELLSRPAVKELFETFSQHAISNTVSPYQDNTLTNSIASFVHNVAGRSPAISNTIAAVLTPNEIIADVSQPGKGAYLGVETGGATGGKFGGRTLTDDVIGTSLGVVFGNTIPALGLTPDDGKENTCLSAEHVTSGQGGTQTSKDFPFLARPH